MKINRIEKIASAVDPSVVYHLRRWNERRRMKALAENAEASDELIKLQDQERELDKSAQLPLDIDEAKTEISSLSDEELREKEESLIEAAPYYKSADRRDERLIAIARGLVVDRMTQGEVADLNAKRSRLHSKMRLVDAESVRPVWLRAGIEKIEGLTDEDGKPLSLDDFLEFAPQSLIDEAYLLVMRRASLSGEETKNSDSPSTSGAEGGEESTTAPTAS